MPACRVMLADLCDPPDTARMPPCGEAETALAIERVRIRLLRQRKRLSNQSADSAALDGVIAQLRRLQNPQMSAYRTGAGLVLSEAFNGSTGVVSHASQECARAALETMMQAAPPTALVAALTAYGETALTAAAKG